jgi:GT2 family glycosyltransferase
MSLPNATPPAAPLTAQNLPLNSLSISVVIYRLNEPELLANLRSLRIATDRAALSSVLLTLIDNSEAGELAEPLHRVAHNSGWPHAAIVSGHGNVGYGAGHNLAMLTHNAQVHLVLNPDVEMDAQALQQGLATLSQHGIVLVGAVGRGADGSPGHLSKRMPSVWTFFLRGFAPSGLKKRFNARLAHYEYHDLATDQVSEVRLVSGAFMLCRSDALRAVGGFDERYFLHFEDLDLSVRMSTQGKVVSDPNVTLIHHGGHAAKKGFAHLKIFLRSGLRFFNTHGWRWR